MLKQEQTETIDLLIEAIEDMIDARDDMWEQEKYHNIRILLHIQEQKYLPAKERVKKILSELLKK